MTYKNITVAHGDGIGPEIMGAVLKILKAAGCPFGFDEIEVGEKVYLQGNASGIPDFAWSILKKNKILLKAPITTPQGGGYNSLNVTFRQSLELFANVRPCKGMSCVKTHFPAMDLVVIRENEEGLYAGIEHRQSHDVYQTLKLFTRAGCERIIRFAFEYAKQFRRRKLTCMSKDNIMKMTDGLFHKTFDNVAKEYPGFELEHQIVDIGIANIATKPETFDVIVTPNLYGDIVSDLTAQTAGSVGLAGSSNIGLNFAMFEAIHGSAPDIAGKEIANPSGLLQAAIQMLVHMGEPHIAAKIHNAWLRTLELGLHTADIYSEQLSKKKLKTMEFADAVIQQLDEFPKKFASVTYQVDEAITLFPVTRPKILPAKKLVGVDIFIDSKNKTQTEILEQLIAIQGPLRLAAVTNRGLQIWPSPLNGNAANLSDQWCCRYFSTEQTLHDTFNVIELDQVLAQIQALRTVGIEFVKLENLYTFDNRRGFSLPQGS